jgi:UDP-N-acetylmuramoyl-L-alanyl-D-glutamate--2,6-diaminopimelate ligase
MTISLHDLIGEHAAVSQDAGSIRVLGLTSDSRAVQPGFVFAALPGSAVDGAKFIPQALSLGAVAVICQTGAYHGPGVVIESENPRRLFALMAARFYNAQPDTIVAVTGTNGKTSVAAFVRQLWMDMGFRAASLGTIGVISPAGVEELKHTTPEPMQLHSIVARLHEDHVDHLAIEASSHGLSQHRLDGLWLTAAAFTNITRDHLDYHDSFEDYFQAKMRLFSELMPKGTAAVINADSPQGADVVRIAQSHELKAYTVGFAGDDLKLISATRDGMGQLLELKTKSASYRISLPLVGDFQASNALVAAGLVIVAGGDEAHVMRSLEALKGAPGRLDLVGRNADGAGVFVDYAHTPDALENAIGALRPYVTGKLVVVFGCGGDRDKGKRPQMGAAAAKFADLVYVTDDNPRGEVASTIRAEVMMGCPNATEIGDRAQAIATAVATLSVGDILLVAGKGHEEGQIIGQTTIPFNDHDAVRAALAGVEYNG